MRANVTRWVMNTETDTVELKKDWLGLLSRLIHDVRSWIEERGWSTREIEIALDDSQIGSYKAPALLMQRDSTKILLEPIARRGSGTDGIVDLYVLPAYDDIASLYHKGDGWHLHYLLTGDAEVSSIREAESKPLTAESFESVIDEMIKNAV